MALPNRAVRCLVVNQFYSCYFWSRRGTTVKPKRQDERQSDTAEALITALKAKDGVMTRTLFEQWKTENSDLSGETLEAIEAGANQAQPKPLC